MRYLFLCAIGENRSPTAANVAARLAREKGLDVQITYGGIDFLLFDDLITNANRETFYGHLKQFDKIFVMEKYMEEGLEKKLGVEPEKIVCLNIPDEYVRDDPILISILENSLCIFI